MFLLCTRDHFWLPVMLIKICLSQEVNIALCPDIVTSDKCHRTVLFWLFPCWPQPHFPALSCFLLFLGFILWIFRESFGLVNQQISCWTFKTNCNLEYVGARWSDNEQSFRNLAVFKSLPVDEESVASQQLWGQQPTHTHSAQAAVLRQPAATRVVPGHHHCFDAHNVAVTAKHIDSGGNHWKKLFLAMESLYRGKVSFPAYSLPGSVTWFIQV